jgi:hypothetical protein
MEERGPACKLSEDAPRRCVLGVYRLDCHYEIYQSIGSVCYERKQYISPKPKVHEDHPQQLVLQAKLLTDIDSVIRIYIRYVYCSL